MRVEGYDTIPLQMRISTIAFMLATFSLVPMSALAHGLGNSFEITKDGYLIDIGYDAEEIRAGETIRFDFNLYAPGGTETKLRDFTDAWVRIAPQDGEGIVFAGDLHTPPFGATGMSFVLPREGLYELTVRYQENGEPIVEAAVPFTAGPASSGERSIAESAAIGALGFLVGATVMHIVRRARSAAPLSD